jgi:FixJ family two-component response regulator
LSYSDTFNHAAVMGTANPLNPLISIIDDDEESREALRGLVKSLGFAVETFASAAEFLAWPHRLTTSCLIADVNMPGMTGVGLHRHLLKTGCFIPTVLVTAYLDEEVRSRTLAEGVVAYLIKPCSDSVLLAVVDDCTRRHGI